MKLLLLVPLVLVLTACGGGGGTSDAPEPPPVVMPEPEVPDPEMPEPQMPDSPEVEQPDDETPSEPRDPEPEPEPEPDPPPPPVSVSPPPPTENPASSRASRSAQFADLYYGPAIGGRMGRQTPAEGYRFRAGAAIFEDPTDLPPVRTSQGVASIPGWSGAHYQVTLPSGHDRGITGRTLVDSFVVYTRRQGSEYLDFGYWVREDATQGFDHFQPIAHGNVDADDIEDVRGTYTYTGSATGLYARQINGLYRQHGQFRASVSLSATFAGKGAMTTIGGTISDFRNSGGSIVNSGWSVNLNQIGYDSGQISSETYKTGSTDGGGSWSVNFFGNTGTEQNPTAPEFVGGSFKKSFSNGRVAGAFGVTKN